MGITKDEFKILCKVMKSVYASPTFLPDQYAFDLWYKMLKDIDYGILTNAVKMHIQTSEYQPTIASLRKCASKMIPGKMQDISEMEAWNIVYKAICNSNYCAEEEFEKFPESIKSAVGSPVQLREWAMMDSRDVNTVIQSNFMRSFKTTQAREIERSMISSDVVNLIDSLTNNLIPAL